MSDIPRWTQRDISELEFPGADEEGFDSIKFVLATDHVAALAQAESRGIERGMRTTGHYRVAYEQGQRDALAKAWAALSSFIEPSSWGQAKRAFAAIKGDSDE
jgi:hypothetical protein